MGGSQFEYRSYRPQEKNNQTAGKYVDLPSSKNNGATYKKMPVDLYIWSGSNYTLKLWFRTRGKELKFLETESYSTPEQVEPALEEIGRKVGNFEAGMPYEDIVQKLGISGKKDDKTTIVKYFWRAKESVAIVVFQNGKILTYNYYDTPKDYVDRDRLPAD